MKNPDLVTGWENFDVFSLNCYSVDPTAAIENVERLGVDLPVMIGEFHFGALDRGPTATGLEGVQTQSERAKAFRYYCERVAAHPYGVGCHFFQCYDQFVLGRFDGENYNIGLFDICSRPYPEMFDAALTAMERTPALMRGETLPTEERPPQHPHDRLLTLLRACGEQDAHAPSRRRAVCTGRLVTRDAACGATASRKAVRPVFFSPASRTPARLRRASRAPCLFLPRVSHARGFFQVRARARLLFSRTGKKPGSCSLRQGENPPGKSPRQTFMNTQNVGPPVPPRTETPEKLSFAPWHFGRFPCQPAVCGPKGR